MSQLTEGEISGHMGNLKNKDNIRRRLIMKYFLLLLSSTILSSSSDVDVVQEENVKIVRAGEDVNFTCTFSSLLQLTKAWFKQTTDGKSLLILSSSLYEPLSWNEDFEKTNRFNVTKGDDHFNLTICKTKPSDSATYYCVVSSTYKLGMGAGTRLLVTDAAIYSSTLDQSLIDAVHPGDSVRLQCSLFTESCAGAHSVYWFRQSSRDSEGLLYTTGERNGQCESSTESQTQSCVYSLHKSNISLSDAGIYYCAVAACGHILFRKGARLSVRERFVTPTLIALGISNIVFLALVVFLGMKQCRAQNKAQRQNEDTMNYAAISFAKKPQNTRKAKAQLTLDQSLYAQVRSNQ